MAARSPQIQIERAKHRARSRRGAKRARRKTSPKGSRSAAGVFTEQRNPAHKQSQVHGEQIGDHEDNFVPKPVHWRLLSAYEACFQDGVPPTDGVIAKRLNVRRETINRWRRRNGRLRAWLYEQIGRHAAELKPFVDRRVAQQAMAGSPEHQKLFYQFVAKVGLPPDEGSDEPPAGSFTMNFLVPRPEMPVIPGVIVRQVQPPQLPKSADAESGHIACSPESASIPVVKIR